MTGTMKVLHPGLETPVAVEAPVADDVQTSRAPSTAGRMLRVALLDNTKVNAIDLLKAVGSRLEALGNVTTRAWRKRHAGESGAPVMPEILQWQPDLMLTGLGD